MKKTVVLVLFFLVVAVSGCAKTDKKAAPQNGGENSVVYKNVSMDEGIRIAKDNPDAVIVDVRRAEEYKAGHIPGSVLLTMEKITEETAAKVLPDKNQLILIYCRSGRRSKIAAKSLLKLGYTNLIEFGGILDYKGEIEY